AGRAAPLRLRKADADRDLSRYRTLLAERSLARSVPELAHLAEALGRRPEARGWATVLARQPSGREAAAAILARLDRTGPPAPPPGLTLAQAVGDLGP